MSCSMFHVLCSTVTLENDAVIGDERDVCDEIDGNRVQRPPTGCVICLLSRWLTRPYLPHHIYICTMNIAPGHTSHILMCTDRLYNEHCTRCRTGSACAVYSEDRSHYVAMAAEFCQDSQFPKTSFSSTFLILVSIRIYPSVQSN